MSHCVILLPNSSLTTVLEACSRKEAEVAEESATEIACIAFVERLAARSGVLANGATQRQAVGRGSSSKTSSLQAVRASEKLRAARRLSARDPAKSKQSSISTRAFWDISVS